jgi:hypothetical protein
LKTYQFDIDRLPSKRRAIIRRFVLMAGVVIPVVAVLGYFVHDVLSPVVMAVPLVIMTGVLVYTARVTLAKVTENYENARVELRPGLLTMRPSGGPGLTLHEEDVQSIQQTRDGSLIVRGRTIQETVYLSPDLFGFDDLRSELANWRDIEAFRQNWSPKTLGMPLLLVALALPMVAPFVMPESAMSWGSPLIMVLYVSAMGAVCFSVVKRTEKKWVRIGGSIVLVVLAIAMLGPLIRLVGAI